MFIGLITEAHLTISMKKHAGRNIITLFPKIDHLLDPGLGINPSRHGLCCSEINTDSNHKSEASNYSEKLLIRKD